MTEAQAEATQLRDQVDGLKAEASMAGVTADRAVAALDSVKADAARAMGSAERHQEVVAMHTLA